MMIRGTDQSGNFKPSWNPESISFLNSAGITGSTAEPSRKNSSEAPSMRHWRRA